VVVISACGSVRDATCGNGQLDDGEACDEGSNNGQLGSCCTQNCEVAAPNVMCREAVGPCDVAETCTGITGACPPDEFKPDGMACAGNGVNACSAADTCVAGACSDHDMPVGTSCATGACRLERCGMGGACAMTAGQRVTIIESESELAAHDMDKKWQTIAQAVGDTATIVPQTALDDIANLKDTDILIVASSIIAVPDTRRATISAFMTSGRGVFIQGEFQATFEGNRVWETVVDGFGANFTWGAEIQNQFSTNAVGCAATTPFPVAAITQNFGVTGSATGAGFSVLQVAPNNVGIAFSFCRQGGGLAIVKTDQDDIRALSPGVPELMKNMLYELSFARFCSL
jgi:hypothetical protein